MSIDNVADITPRIQYTAATSQVAFDYPFPIFADADLTVDVDGVTKTLTTDYTVTGAGADTGGTVTFVTAPGSGAIVTIYRETAIARSTDFQQNGPFSSTSHNDELDKITIVLQELKAQIGRAIRFPFTAVTTNAQALMSPFANFKGKFLRVTSAGALEGAEALDNVTALSQELIGENLFPQTVPEVAGVITPTNPHRLANPYDVRRTGVVGDGVTDDTLALRDACDAAGPWGIVYVAPELNCLITSSIVNSTLAARAAGQKWIGGGKISTVNGFDHHVFDINGITDFTVEGLRGEAGTLGTAIASATARFFNVQSSSHRCKLLYSNITGFQSAARFNASEHCQAIGNDIITPAGWGINVQTDAHDTVVAFNRINGVAGEHGIYWAGSSGNNIRGGFCFANTINGSTIDGIKAAFIDDLRVLFNNSYGNTGQGCYLNVAVNRAIVGFNAFSTNGEQGVLIFSSTSSDVMDRNQVVHNIIRKNDRDGVRVQTSGTAAINRTLIESNDIEDNNQEASSFRGVSLTGSGVDATRVRQNHIGDEGTAVNVASGVTDTTIENNDLDNNTTDIADAGTRTVIRQPSIKDTRTGAGAISLLTETTLIVTTAADALTLADGYEGQQKYLVMITDGGAGTLTPSNLANGSTLTFDDVGDSAHLFFINGAWTFMGGTATLA